MNNKRKTTKRNLISSVISLILCVSMLIGTTFAWFTDTASTAVNKIQSGKLDVALEMKDTNGNWVNAEGETLKWKTADNREQAQVLWEPGCTYELPELRIVNNGNLTLKYKMIVSGIVGDAKLLEAIDFTYGTGIDIDAEVILAPNAATEGIIVQGHMKEDAGNEYQDLSIDGIGITVIATQKDAEFDSFDNQYDKDAVYPAAPTIVKATASGTVTNQEAATTISDTASGVEAEIPADTLNTNDAVTLTVERTAMTADSVTYDIDLKVNDVSPTTPLSNPVAVKIDIGAGLKDVAATHNGTPMTKVDNAVNDQEYSYDSDSGILTIVTKTFSPFGISYKTDFEAKIGNTGYAKLSDAFENAKDGETVTLLKDVDIKKTMIINKKVSLDMNSKRMYNSNDIWNDSASEWSFISVSGNGAELTVTGNGNFEAKENDCYVIDIRDDAKCIIQNGTFAGNIHAVYVFKGALVVNGGTYSVQQKYSASQPDDFVLNCYDSNYTNGTATIEVSGGKFYNYDPANAKCENPVANFVVKGKGTVKNGDWYEVIDGTFVSSESELKTALNEKVDTVYLSGDIKLTDNLSINTDITLIGNGNAKITDYPVYVGVNNTVTFKNMNFDETVAKDKASSVYGEGFKGTVIFDGCRFGNSNWESVQITPKGDSTITLKNCTFTASKDMKRFIHIQPAASNSYRLNITIENCTFNGCEKVNYNTNDKVSVIDLDYIADGSILTLGGCKFFNTDGSVASNAHAYFCKPAPNYEETYDYNNMYNMLTGGVQSYTIS